MAEKPYTVNRIEEDFRLNPRGEFVRVQVVTFNVGDQGPFTEEFRREEFTPEEVRRRLEERARVITEIL